MIRILWTPASLEDLKAISYYIEREGNLLAANRVCRAIYNSVQLLRRFPESGRAGLEPTTREFVVSDFPAYIIVYRTSQDQLLEVLRIWHAAQQRVTG